ncbi:MAG: hypothetical protein NBV67_01725 [Tagaea sp.]|nr:hypothetical protein [Tagaea sp.]
METTAQAHCRRDFFRHFESLRRLYAQPSRSLWRLYRPTAHLRRATSEGIMDDALYIVLGLGFFALMALFARGCARL